MKKLLTRLIGEWHWVQPAWLLALGAWLRGRRDAVKKRPSLYAGATLMLVALSVGAVELHKWWEARPKPEEIRVSGTAPGPTPIQKDAKPEPLYVRFARSVAPLAGVGKPITQGIGLEPPTPGEWKWENDRTLQFTPSKDWAIGQTYTAKISRQLLEPHITLNTYAYEFTTKAFAASVQKANFYVDPADPKVKKAVFTVRFTHPVDPSSFEKRTSLVKAGKAIHLHVSYDEFRSEAYVHSEPLPIPDDSERVELSVDSGVSAQAGSKGTPEKLHSQVTVPGIYSYFHMNGIDLSFVRNEQYEPEQVMLVSLSDTVVPKEMTQRIKAWLLPVDRPKTTSHEAVKKYTAWSAAEIDQEILGQAAAVKLSELPIDHDSADLLSYRYRAPQGRFIYIEIAGGLESPAGYKMKKSYATVVRVPPFPQELQIMYDGAVLSSSGQTKLNVLSRDLQAVKVTLSRVKPSELHHFVTQTNGTFKRPNFKQGDYYFSYDNVSELMSDVLELDNTHPGRTQYSAFDLSPHFAKAGGKYGLFHFKIESYDPARQSVTGLNDERVVLVTDLGVLVKDNVDGTHDVFVQSLAKGSPVAAARVEVLGKNGLPIVSVPTDSEGHAELPVLRDFVREKAPVAYVVRQGDDVSFLPFDRRDRGLNLSRFDIGGERAAPSADSLSAYVFSERGLYRPGDPAHIAMIVKPNDWSRSVAGIPLELAVTDPRGNEVVKHRYKVGDSGFDDYTLTTDDTSPTGTYGVGLYLLDPHNNSRSTLVGSTTIRVEEFIPDRLRITSRIEPHATEGWVKEAQLTAHITLQNLFGTPAESRDVRAQISVAPASPAFRAYKDFVFRAPHKNPLNYSEELAATTTNDKGEASFDIKLRPLERALYWVTLTADGYEAEGGRGVTTVASTLVSSLPMLIGYKSVDNLHYIKLGTKRTLSLVAIDAGLKKIEGKDLHAELRERKYVSVLVRQRDGTLKYESVLKEALLSDKPLQISADGSSFDLPTQKPGDFVLVIRTAQGDELNHVDFNVMGEGNVARSLEHNAELEIALDKPDFQPGDDIEVSIRAPYTGAGLITIERDRVYAHKWFETTTTSAVQKITIPKTLEGNGYVTVTFVRGLDSPEVFTSPLSYGVAPFAISRASRVVKIDLSPEEKVEPGETLSISYKTDKPSRIAVFAVDEGILQVARYQTPDPLAHFFKKRALQVTTMQMLDLLLPEGKADKKRAGSGGDEGMKAIGANLNPFKRKRDKPAVYWSGIVEADEKQRTLKYKVPDTFNGSMKVFAIAVSGGAVGVAQKQTVVRGPFVITPNVPTFVSPGDKFKVSVAVANGTNASSVALHVDASEGLVLTGGDRTLKVTEGHEGVETFDVEAKAVGEASLTFTAGGKTKLTTSLSVRPRVPYEVWVQAGIARDATQTVTVQRKLLPQFRKVDAAVSALPLAFSHGLYTYLDQYPYGCTEQLTSQAWARLIFATEPELGAPNKGKLQEHLDYILRVLRSRQKEDGGFGMWAANSFEVPWHSVYAAHFLTEMKARGRLSDDKMLSAALIRLRALLGARPSEADARLEAYALYVLARNGKVEGGAASALAERMRKTPALAADVGAALLAGALQLYKQDDKAERLIAGATLGAEHKPKPHELYSALLNDALVLEITARHFPQRLKQLDATRFKNIVETVANNGYYSLSAAYVLLAMSTYMNAAKDTPFTAFNVLEVDAGNITSKVALAGKWVQKGPISDKAALVRFDNTSELPMFFQLTSAGFEAEPFKTDLKKGLELIRELKGSKVQLGEELEVHVKVRADAAQPYVAVIDLLPAGFEPVLESIVTIEQSTEESAESVEGAEPSEAEGEGDGGGEGEPAVAEDGEDAESRRVDVRPSSVTRSVRYGDPSSTWQPTYVDVREDRLVLYGNVSDKIEEFVYRVRATNRGKYFVPALYGEGMYNREVKARSVEGEVSVE